MSRRADAVLVIAASAAIIGVVLLLTTARGGDHAHYEVAPLALLVIGLSPIGVSAAWAGGRGRAAALSFATVGLLSSGLLSVFSGAGLPLLLAGLIAGVLVIRSVGHGARARLSVLGGAVTAVGLMTLTLVLLQPALVDCRGPSASVSFATGTRVMTSTSADGRQQSGEITDGGRTVRFICVDGHLTDFGP